ncbi:MAG TPA: AAA family ATPase [Kofleriaceae bacterium]|jgi:chloramphenicol 3-O phosphotransferase
MRRGIVIALSEPTDIVLNGPSSAGKSTLAVALAARFPERMAVLQIDKLFAVAPPEAPNNWQLFSTLTTSLFASAAAFARSGYDVVVDTVFERVDCVNIARIALEGVRSQFVAVTASVAVLEQREHVRGNRRAGLAKEQRERVFHDVEYSIAIDTTIEGTEESVRRLAALLVL